MACVFQLKNLFYTLRIVQSKLKNWEDALFNYDNRYLITDDNLASEFKVRERPMNKNRAWYMLF